MTEICVNTFETMQVGETRHGFIWAGDDEDEITSAFIVLAVISRREYLDYVKEVDKTEFIKRSIYDDRLKFYRVRILD